MPHYQSLLKSLTKYVERHHNESTNLEKYIILQNVARAKMESDATSDDLVSSLETHVLNSSHIVLTTLGSAGGRVLESASQFKVVVIDEAAQSAEPSTLVALQLGSSHAILVGDPQQVSLHVIPLIPRQHSPQLCAEIAPLPLSSVAACDDIRCVRPQHQVR